MAAQDLALAGIRFNGGGSTDACGADAQVQFVKEVSESYYYWYDELAQVDAEDYSNPLNTSRPSCSPFGPTGPVVILGFRT